MPGITGLESLVLYGGVVALGLLLVALDNWRIHYVEEKASRLRPRPTTEEEGL